VQLVCRDIRPFQTVAGEGFKALADALIMIGIKYGQVAANEILPYPTTISRNIETKYAEIKENIMIPQLLKYVNVHGGSVTTDMWTDQFKQRYKMTRTSVAKHSAYSVPVLCNVQQYSFIQLD
jgi:Hermes transposase DNA-binding domain